LKSTETFLNGQGQGLSLVFSNFGSLKSTETGRYDRDWGVGVLISAISAR